MGQWQRSKRFTVDLDHGEEARAIVATISAGLDPGLVRGLLDADQDAEPAVAAQRERVRLLKIALRRVDHADARRLEALADALVRDL